MLVEVSWFFSYLVLIVFRVVATIISIEPFAEDPVNIFCFFDFFIFAHHNNVWFDQLLFEARSLSEESLDHAGMILCKHCWDGIPLGGELKN